MHDRYEADKCLFFCKYSYTFLWERAKRVSCDLATSEIITCNGTVGNVIAASPELTLELEAQPSKQDLLSPLHVGILQQLLRLSPQNATVGVYARVLLRVLWNKMMCQSGKVSPSECFLCGRGEYLQKVMALAV
jgi:hypothetical protein